MSPKKVMFLVLMLVLSLFSVGCEDFIDDIVAIAKIQKKAEIEGTVAFCPEDRPYRVGGLFTGVCTDENGLDEFTDIKLGKKTGNEDDFVKGEKARVKGEKAGCSSKSQYLVKVDGEEYCLTKSEFEDYTEGNAVIGEDTESPDDEDEEDDEEEGGDCKYDSDCDPVCEGDTKWKQGCNARTNTCERTFDSDCTAETEKIGGITFKKTCSGGACATDTSAVSAKKAELENKKSTISTQVKQWTADRQSITTMMYDAQNKCISALADVTNKLIIDTALALKSPPTTLLSVGSDNTNRLIDAMASDSSKMSTEEFIAWNCNFYKALQVDLDVLAKKISKAQAEYKTIDGQLKGFP
jgi:hypothetical protein